MSTPKVRVIRNPGRFYAGSMPAAVGMQLLDGGEITKVNARSVVISGQYGSESAFRTNVTQSISVTEAKRFGWVVDPKWVRL